MDIIDQASFAQYDMLLYLDTHPDDAEAFAYYRKQTCIREDALKQYAQHYGPLTMDLIDDTCSDSWKWMMQPWPWEIKKKGRC
ncbi:MAG: spore coat protein CotJB [Clostridia bacterium]|nr:spore coat protein CotJB [Clostridia bacterium]NCC43922.1 spore coat protein CotJB [Clostridia bacterium]